MRGIQGALKLTGKTEGKTAFGILSAVTAAENATLTHDVNGDWSTDSDLQTAVSLNDKSVIDASPLRFSMDGITLTTDVTIGNIERYQINDTYAAHPETILDHPCVQIMKNIPAVWGETIVFPVSEIGELAAFARRRGDAWFLALMNSTTARTVEIALSFLGTGAYQSLYAYDMPDRADAVRLSESTWQPNDTISIAMRGGGGFIAQCTQKGP